MRRRGRHPKTPPRQPVDIVPRDRRRAPPGAGRAEHALSKQNVEISDLATRSHAADRPARRPRLARQAGADRGGKPPCLLVAMRESGGHIGTQAGGSGEGRGRGGCDGTWSWRWSAEKDKTQDTSNK